MKSEDFRNEIGRSKQDIFTNIFSVIGFWVGTVSYSGNQSIFGMDLKTLFIVSSIVYTVWIVCLIVNGCQFNADTLMDEIEKQNELSKQYSHSIVLIKNTFEKYPNKYLVYYDTRWDCWFFPNWHTMEDVQENKKNIIEHISQDLKADRNQISISYLFSKVREKYSHSFKKSKVYDHSFYSKTFICFAFKDSRLKISSIFVGSAIIASISEPSTIIIQRFIVFIIWVAYSLAFSETTPVVIITMAFVFRT